MRHRGGIVVVTAIAVAVLLPAAASAAPGDVFGSSGTTVVTPEKSNQFAGTFDRGAGSREFTDRLGAPPDGGTGALELRTPADGDKVQFVTDEVAGPLGQFAESSYWAVRDPASTAETGRAPSFQIAVDVNGGELGPRELHLLTYLPDAGPAGEWTRYDLGAGRWCVTQQVDSVDAYQDCRAGGERRTLDEIMDEYPGISVYAAGVNQGIGDGGLVGAVDLIRVGTRTYDLEPSAP